MSVSCTKKTDTKATPDPRLTTHYCNDPAAVNYNWGFPGIADNTVCFYPTDIFKGVYEYHDSVFFKSSGFFIRADTFLLTINRHSNSKFSVIGFCASGDSLLLTAGANYIATVDTTLGDSTTTIRGQALCSTADTINGVLNKDRLNDSIIYINFVVASDTGVISTHVGTARLLHK
jgi:hypothetical protein